MSRAATDWEKLGGLMSVLELEEGMASGHLERRPRRVVAGLVGAYVKMLDSQVRCEKLMCPEERLAWFPEETELAG